MGPVPTGRGQGPLPGRGVQPSGRGLPTGSSGRGLAPGAGRGVAVGRGSGPAGRGSGASAIVTGTMNATVEKDDNLELKLQPQPGLILNSVSIHGST